MEFNKFIIEKNKKIIFTPGPSSLSIENIKNLGPYFGRGDKEYSKIENFVISKLKKMSKKKKILCMQGSGSFAIEVMIVNYLYGRVLLIDTGVYSDRIKDLIKFYKKNLKKINYLKSVSWKDLNTIDAKYDWVVGCYTETSIGLKIPIDSLSKLKKKTGGKLMLDATASFGLENKHYLADVFSFSSCKGLFGLTGACFIASNWIPNNKLSFNLNIDSFKNKKMTGPYHSISSLYYVLKNYNKFKKSVLVNKKKCLKLGKKFLVYPKKFQPNLCTYLKCKIIPKRKNIVMYKSRANIMGEIVCHLGETHLKNRSKGKILDYLKFDKFK